jgi:hypothetical protein
MVTINNKKERRMAMNISQKVADRPHVWTIVLSFLALAVSIGSYVQSRQAVNLSREVSRAAVQVNSVRLIDNPENLSFLGLDVTFTNYGQLTAQDIVTTLEWDVTDIAVPTGTATYEQPEIVTLAGKSSKTVRLQANRRFTGGSGLSGGPGLKGPKSKLLVFGTAHYTDASGLRGNDPWCFMFDTRDKNQTSSLELRPCTYPYRDYK